MQMLDVDFATLGGTNPLWRLRDGDDLLSWQSKCNIFNKYLLDLLAINSQVSTTKILMVKTIVSVFASFSYCLSAFQLEIST